MSTQKIFDDNSIVEWVDKETLKYTEGAYSVLVWVDFEPGFFSNCRIIKSSSISTWKTKPDDSSEEIDGDKRQEIINKIKKYYTSFKKKCRVEI